MTAMPRGNEPVLFSRRRNSSVLMDGGGHVGVNAIADKRFKRIENQASRSSSRPLARVPLRPVEKICWRNSLSRPSACQVFTET